jgi:hypothetical protein
MGSLRIPVSELRSDTPVIVSLQQDTIDEDVKWQCHTSGGWTDCDPPAQKALSQAEKDGVTSVVIGQGSRKYEYDIEQLTRLNVKSQKKRPLRRQRSGTSSSSSRPSHESAEERNVPADLEDLWEGHSHHCHKIQEHQRAEEALNEIDELEDALIDELASQNEFMYPETQELPGGKYVGEAIDGTLAHGKGFLCLDGGSFYLGAFSLGKVTGKGARFCPANNHVVIGSWRRGRPHGACLEHSPTCTRLAAFKDGEAEGEGILSGKPVFFGVNHTLVLRKARDPVYVKNLSRSVVNAYVLEVCACLCGSLSKIKEVRELDSVLKEAMMWLDLTLPSENDLDVPKELLQVTSIVRHHRNFDACKPVYEIKAVPGKGLGMFASKGIAAQQRIVVEAPLIIAKSFKAAKVEATRLLEPRASSFWKLHDKFAEQGQPKEAGGIVLSNAIPCWPHSISVGGVHGIISRANHSCKPNARMFWEPVSGQSILLASRSILRGEEICISYLRGHFWPRAKRVSYLQNCFGFECGCCACTAAVDKRKESDARQLVMGRLQRRIPLLRDQPVLAVRASKHLIRLLIEDTSLVEFSGLAHQVARICLNAYGLALKVTSPDRAAPWLTTYARCMTLAEGLGSVESRRANRLRECLLNNETLIGSGSAGPLCHSDLSHLLLQPQELSGPFNPRIYGDKALVPCR